MKINDLKIGDRVKVKCQNVISCGRIFSLNDYYYNYEDCMLILFDGEITSKTVNKNKIVAKLEPTPQEIQYKEIPIEKEFLPYLCPQCHRSHDDGIHFIVQNSPLEAKYCSECIRSWQGKNERKPAPKSFEFDFTPTEWKANRSYFNWEYTMDGYGLMNGFGRVPTTIKELPSQEWVKVGKTYTIEIKEKEQ